MPRRGLKFFHERGYRSSICWPATTSPPRLGTNVERSCSPLCIGPSKSQRRPRLTVSCRVTFHESCANRLNRFWSTSRLMSPLRIVDWYTYPARKSASAAMLVSYPGTLSRPRHGPCVPLKKKLPRMPALLPPPAPTSSIATYRISPPKRISCCPFVYDSESDTCVMTSVRPDFGLTPVGSNPVIERYGAPARSLPLTPVLNPSVTGSKLLLASENV